MKHNELIHKEDRYSIIDFISFISPRIIKEQLLNTVLYKDQLPDLFSAKSQQTFMTNIYTTRNKSELESFSQNKTILFSRIARENCLVIIVLAIFGFGRFAFKITHKSTSCMRAHQFKVVNIANVIRVQKNDMPSPQSLEAIRR